MNCMMFLTKDVGHDPRVMNEGKSLMKQGVDVRVLMWDKDDTYNLRYYTVEGVKVHVSKNWRYFNIFKMEFIKLVFWWFKAYFDAGKILKRYDIDILHCHDFSTLPIGVMLKIRYNKKLVFDAHEIWWMMISRDTNKIAVNVIRIVECLLMPFTDTIITVTEPLKEYYENLHWNVVLVMNCKKVQKFTETDNKYFTLGYFGVIGKQRFLFELVELIGEMEEVRLVLAGEGKTQIVNELFNKIEEYDNVKWLGLLPRKKVMEYTKNLDVIPFIINPKDKNDRLAVGNKMFESMALGKPVICTKNTYAGDFVDKHETGLTVEYNKESVKKAILKLKNDTPLYHYLGMNAFLLAKREYNWDSQAKKLIGAYYEVTLND